MRPERVLIRGVNWLGDAVMALPAIERLREVKHDAHFALLTASKLADLFTGHPAIDEVIPFEKSEGIFATVKRLRLRHFDLSLILPNSFRTALESWLARIPVRVGYPGNGRSPLLTKVVARRRTEVLMRKRSESEVRQLVATSPNRLRDTFPSSAHHIHNYLHLTTALGASPDPLPPTIVVTDLERASLRARFDLPDTRPIYGLNPGAEYGPAKRWPIENFIETAKLVQRNPFWLVFGGGGDREYANLIEKTLGKRSLNLAGKTTLRELCVALSLCDIVLTNDTGPMHLAAAVGTRLVVPFGSTSPELTGPGPEHHLILGQAPCAPCFRRACPIDLRCLRSITPRQVAELFPD